MTLEEAIEYCDKHLPRLVSPHDDDDSSPWWKPCHGWGHGACNLWFPILSQPGMCNVSPGINDHNWEAWKFDALPGVVEHVKRKLIVLRLIGEYDG